MSYFFRGLLAFTWTGHEPKTQREEHNQRNSWAPVSIDKQSNNFGWRRFRCKLHFKHLRISIILIFRFSYLFVITLATGCVSFVPKLFVYGGLSTNSPLLQHTGSLSVFTGLNNFFDCTFSLCFRLMTLRMPSPRKNWRKEYLPTLSETNGWNSRKPSATQRILETHPRRRLKTKTRHLNSAVD